MQLNSNISPIEVRAYFGLETLTIAPFWLSHLHLCCFSTFASLAYIIMSNQPYITPYNLLLLTNTKKMKMKMKMFNIKNNKRFICVTGV